jgi:hypothetical protein
MIGCFLLKRWSHFYFDQQRSGFNYDEPGGVAEPQLFRTGDWSRGPFIPPTITRFDMATMGNARLSA